MDADAIDWQWQELTLHARLSETDGDAFETLFQSIGKALWGSAFQATIPMGSRGDLKCDGFHLDTGCVYQCYGPRYGRADVNEALNKINKDFRGAKEHWKEQMKRWNFVVGLYRNKTPSELVRLIAQLAVELNIPAGILHRDDIIELARQIKAAHRASLFGKAPVLADMIRRVTYENIGRALAFIRAESTRSPTELIALPPDIEAKVAFNCLPLAVRHFLTVGQTSADRVRQYLLDQAEPDEADRMAEGFSKRYRAVRDEGAEPAQAFAQMLTFAGGVTGDPDRETAALAIVTHFFATCEIFERPPEKAMTT